MSKIDEFFEHQNEILKINRADDYFKNSTQEEIKVNTNPNSQEDSADNSAIMKGSRFPKKILFILHEWFSAHMEDPYPAKEEKKFLSDKTGLSMKQVK